MADSRLPATVQMASDTAAMFGFHYIAEQLDHLWGDPQRLYTAAEVWSFMSSEVITRGVGNELNNRFEKKFAGGEWSGEARDAYRRWLLRFKDQTISPMAALAKEMATILGEVAKKLVSMRVDIQWMAAEFLAAAGLAYYKGKPGKGAHAKPAGGAHGKTQSTLQIGIILLALADFGRRLTQYYNACVGDLNDYAHRIKRLKTDHSVGAKKGQIVPPFSTSMMADPRNWQKS